MLQNFHTYFFERRGFRLLVTAVFGDRFSGFLQSPNLSAT